MDSQLIKITAIAAIWALMIVFLQYKDLKLPVEPEPKVEQTSEGMELVLKAGRVDGFYKDVYVVSIDNKETWLIVTPTLEVRGYLHKMLPNADISTFRKLEEIPNGPHFKFYYKDL